MALPGGILKCEICDMSCVNTIIYDRTCTDMTLYPQLICHACQDKRKIIWDYLDRIKKKMKECICFPSKKEPHDKCCTCIQDESRGWKDCPEHGHKYKAAMKDIKENVLGSPIFNKVAVEAECRTRLEKAGFKVDKFEWSSDYSLTIRVLPNISHIEVKFAVDEKPVASKPKLRQPECRRFNPPQCCSTHAEIYYNTPG